MKKKKEKKKKKKSSLSLIIYQKNPKKCKKLFYLNLSGSFLVFKKEIRRFG